MGGTRERRASAAREGSFRVAVVAVAVAVALPYSAAMAEPAAAPPRLRIKNAHTVMVALGRAHEAASGIRPDKNAWTLELPAELVGTVAELQDVTPDVPKEHWTMAVVTDHLILDAARFLPSHAYRVELRKGRQVVGGALVYLYPPPASRVSRVVLDDRPEPGDARAPASDGAPGITPKGGL